MSRNLDEVWEAFDAWERTQVCIRGHVRRIRETVELLARELELIALDRDGWEGLAIQREYQRDALADRMRSLGYNVREVLLYEKDDG